MSKTTMSLVAAALVLASGTAGGGLMHLTHDIPKAWRAEFDSAAIQHSRIASKTCAELVRPMDAAIEALDLVNLSESNKGKLGMILDMRNRLHFIVKSSQAMGIYLESDQPSESIRDEFVKLQEIGKQIRGNE